MRTKKILILAIVSATLCVVGFFIVETYRVGIKDAPESTNINNVHTKPTSTDKDFVARVGLGNSVAINNIVIAFLDVIEDSRCPVNVQCMWAGRVVAKIMVDSNGHNKEYVIESGKPLLVDGYSLSFGDIEPATHTEQKINKRDYVGVFKVEKVIDVLFTCSNGFSITARFIPGEVELKPSDRNDIIRLPIALSASGARYANSDESVVFWNKGNTAFMTENGTTTYDGCVTQE